MNEVTKISRLLAPLRTRDGTLSRDQQKTRAEAYLLLSPIISVFHRNLDLESKAKLLDEAIQKAYNKK
ncbi:MAG TPA: hypothetical protein ENL16_01435 [Candidatus Woesearchaeota archaeon]|nr:hypothetical protein [Candidatus Woesearchaeota archaeon]